MVRFLIVVVVMVLVPSAVAAGQWVDSQQLKHLSSVHVELMVQLRIRRSTLRAGCRCHQGRGGVGLQTCGAYAWGKIPSRR